jgi:hypothetical protein
MGYAKHIGRVGALAIALGIGYGVSDATAFADAPDTSAAGTSSSSTQQAAPVRRGASTASSPRASARDSAGPRAAASVKRVAAGDSSTPVDVPTVTIPKAGAAVKAAVPAASVSVPAVRTAAPAATTVQSAAPASAAALTIAPTALRQADRVALPPRLTAIAQRITAALSSLLANAGSGPNAGGPLAWIALAWSRLQLGQAAARSTASALTTSAPVQSGNLLTNPGAEFGDPSESGFSAVSIPGWTATGTPTVIKYGTPRNLWPMGVSFPMPNLPKFFSFPQASTNPTGGNQFFGGGNVASATLTQTVDLSAAGSQIDLGGVTYNLGGEFGGFLIDPSQAHLKVTFLDQNKTYLGTASTKSVGMLSRLFMTGFKERSVTGTLPEGTRYAQVELDLQDNNWRLLGFRARYNNAYADNLSFTIGAPLAAAGNPTPPPSSVGSLDHVYMVYMENKGYDDIVGSPNAPFTNSLINAYGFFNGYYGLTHPSLPNYYPILGGSDFGKTYNCSDTCIDAPNTLMENLDNASLVWRSYAQGFTAGMNPLQSSGNYAVDETAFPAYTYFANNPDPNYAKNHLLPLEQMATDLQSTATSPSYAWFAADEDSNGEGPVDTLGGVLRFALSQISPKHQYNVPALDKYLSETIPMIMNSASWNTDTVDNSNKSVIVVTFDEDNNNTSLGFGNEGNHIVTVVIPNQDAIDAGMRAGHYIASDHYNQYSLLNMIETSLGLPTLTNNDKFAAPMNEAWGSTLPSV